MITINFASRNYRLVGRIRTALNAGSIILAMMTAVMLWNIVTVRANMPLMDRTLQELEASDVQIRPVLHEREQLVKDLTAMSGLMESRKISWTGLLTSIEDVVPVGVALNHVAFNPKDSSLTLDGVALSPESLRNLVVGLEKTASFKDPFLKHQSLEKGVFHSMWLQSIAKIQGQLWLRENGKQLRTSAGIFAVLICINLLLYAFLIAPYEAQQKTWEAKSAELRKRRAEAVLFKRQTPLFAGILAGIPAQKDMPLLVKEVVQMARSQNVSVAAINYDIPRRESGELAMLSFSFPVEGRYHDVKRFIYDVETSDRLIGIQELGLESDKGRVKLQMKLMTYVRGN